MKNILFIVLIYFSFNFSSHAQILVPVDSSFLSPTEHINSDHPDIIQKAMELTKGLKTENEKVQNIFEFVRDSYTLDNVESFIASDLLKQGGNSCIRRSVLLAALCRAVGIQARLNNQIVTINNLKLGEQIFEQYSFVHGLTGIKVNGEWHLYDPVGNTAKWSVWNDGIEQSSDCTIRYKKDADCLFNETEKIKMVTMPIYFSDYDEFYEMYVELMYSAKIGLTGQK